MWISDILKAFEEIGEEKGIFTIGCIDKIEGNYIFFSSGRIYSMTEHQFVNKE